MKDYFGWSQEESEKESRRISKAIWLGCKMGLTAFIWFYSSIVVAPVYLVIVATFVKVPTNSFLYDLWFYGGAIVWYLILYVTVSLLFRWAKKKILPSTRRLSSSAR